MVSFFLIFLRPAFTRFRGNGVLRSVLNSITFVFAIIVSRVVERDLLVQTESPPGNKIDLVPKAKLLIDFVYVLGQE